MKNVIKINKPQIKKKNKSKNSTKECRKKNEYFSELDYENGFKEINIDSIFTNQEN